MKPLFNISELNSLANKSEFPFECEYCHETFFLNRHDAKNVFAPHSRRIARFCSRNCAWKAKISITYKEVICLNCNKSFMKAPKEIEKSPNNFCSKSCAATYRNTHKTTGNRRSKLEKYLEYELPILYPTLDFHFNRKDTINSELDIFIPSLKLAFELNGIFHYEPIYGSDKLAQIQNNDTRKFQACIENGIEMCTIDSSGLKYFKPKSAEKYLRIIVNIIDAKLSAG